jgi:hypothetical protein
MSQLGRWTTIVATPNASQPTNKLIVVSGMPDSGGPFDMALCCHFGTMGSNACKGKNLRNIWAWLSVSLQSPRHREARERSRDPAARFDMTPLR